MTTFQMGLTVAVCTAATMLTRFLPFLIFSSKDQQPPEVVQYLGRVLPAAIFGMLILYCLKSVTPFAGSHGIPEAIAIAVTIACTGGSTRHWSPSPAVRCVMCCWCSWCSHNRNGRCRWGISRLLQ